MYKMCHGFLDGNWGGGGIPNREKRAQGSQVFKSIVPKGQRLFRFSFFPRAIICTYRLSGRAGWDNIWLEVMAYGSSAARSVRRPDLT